MRPQYILLPVLLPVSAFCQQVFEPKDPANEPYGAQWNLAKNAGQTFDLGNNFSTDVVIQSVGTTPSLYLFKNNRTGFTYADPVAGMVSRIDLAFTGENALNSTPQLYHETGMVYNFYEANTPNGVTGVAAGKHAIYENVYPDIDFHVLSNPSGPKFYIVIRPGGNPADMFLQVSGHDSLKLDISGDLEIWFENKFMRLREGYAYQQVGQTIVNVPWVAHYDNTPGSSLVTFDLGTYDPGLPLILMIKPWLPPPPPPGGGGMGQLPEWSTYFAGNTQDDFINDLTHDGDGFVYFTGYSKSTNGLPITVGTEPYAGAQDAIIGRINSNYEITVPYTWMTYYGAEDNDRGVAAAYTPTEGGRLAVCGTSASGSNQLIQPLGSSWTTTGFNFLALFDPADGTRIYGTRLPHIYSPTYEAGGPADVDYDTDGNLYLVGYGDMTNTWFNDYVTGPSGTADYTSMSYFNFDSDLLYHDGYVARFDPAMQLTWLTALGGPNDERVFACAVDKDLNRLVVVGKTATVNNTGIADCPISTQAGSVSSHWQVFIAAPPSLLHPVK